MPKYTNEFKDELIDFKRPNLWMHSIDRKYNSEGGQILGVVLIVLVSLIAVGTMLYAIGEYPKAYPSKSVTVNK